MQSNKIHFLSTATSVSTSSGNYSSEDMFESAFHFAPIGMALVDLSGRWIKVNNALCRVVGYSEQELLATDFQSITHPEDLEEDLAYVHSLLAGEIETYKMEKRYFHKNGGVVWVLLSVSLVRNDSGTPAFFISQIKDITERKQAVEALRLSEQRFQDMSDNVPGVVYQYLWHPQGKGRFTFLSRKGAEFFGKPRSETINQDFDGIDFIHPDDRDNYLEVIARTSLNLEYRYWEGRRAELVNGNESWFSISAMPRMQMDGSVLWSGILQDITERKVMQARLQDSLAMHESLLASLREGVLLIGDNRVVLACNQSAEHILGISRAEMLNKEVTSQQWRLVRQNGSVMPYSESPHHVSLVTGKPLVNSVLGVCVNDHPVKWLSVNAIPLVRVGEDKPYAAMISFSDYTESKKLLDELEAKANTDFLTGAFNRRHFFELARCEIDRAIRYDRPLSLLMLDIDYFKNINDTYGHLAGDQVLVELVNALKQELRTLDVVGRWGGEEFAILLPETSLENSLMIANRLCSSISNHQLLLEDQQQLKMTISIGVAHSSLKSNNLEKLFRHADEALYAAKAAGRNQVAVAD